MSEDQIKYLIFLAIKAERERIVSEINKISVSYKYDDSEDNYYPDLSKLVDDLAAAISGS